MILGRTALRSAAAKAGGVGPALAAVRDAAIDEFMHPKIQGGDTTS
jgi:hypothetical protein